MSFCTKCGNQLSEEARFCSKCGNPVNVNFETQNFSVHNSVDNQKKTVGSGVLDTPAIKEIDNGVPAFQPPERDETIPIFSPPTDESNPTFMPPPDSVPESNTGFAYGEGIEMPEDKDVYTAEDIKNNKVISVVGYVISAILSVWALLILPFLGKSSKFARFHINQAFVVCVFEFVSMMVCGMIAGLFTQLFWVIGLIFALLPMIISAVLRILGIINVCSGLAKPLPIIGSIKLLDRNTKQKVNKDAGKSSVPFNSATQNFEGMKCHIHSNELAVAVCAKCGKPICQDCADVYGVSSGEYANQHLCYNCCQQLVSENVSELKKQKAKIITSFVMTGIGMLIGALIGSIGGVPGIIIGLLLGGSLWTFIKAVAYAIRNIIAQDNSFGILAALFVFIKELIICVYRTITKIIQYISYIIKTSKFIQEDQEALAQMREYMQYTLVRNQNKGVDLQTLLKENSSLANNSYAQVVLNKGEQQAEAAVRRCVATINENGEIIRNFAA